MSFFANSLAARRFIFAVLLISSSGARMSRAEEAIAFPFSGDIRGSKGLFDKQPTRVIIGEIHGTAEIPQLVAVVVRSLSAKTETVLCLEMAASEQPRLDAFLASDGGDAAVRALLAGPHWLVANPDGRASTGHLKMLQLVHQLSRDGRQIHLAAIDTDLLQDLAATKKSLNKEEVLEISRKRDQQMADNVGKVVAKHPDANIVVLVGNVHAGLRRGTEWDAEYEPLGWHLKKKLPGFVSLNYQSSGGEAWVLTEKGAGPMKFTGENRGKKPFIEMSKDEKDDYDGILYVGSLTAAPPAKNLASVVDDALKQIGQGVSPVAPESKE